LINLPITRCVTRTRSVFTPKNRTATDYHEVFVMGIRDMTNHEKDLPGLYKIKKN